MPTFESSLRMSVCPSVCLSPSLWLIAAVVNVSHGSRRLSRCVSTLMRPCSSTFNYSIRELREFQPPAPPPALSPPTWQIPAQAGADVGSKIWGCGSSCHKTRRRKYHRTEKCAAVRAISVQAGPGRRFRNLSLLAATSKAVLYRSATHGAGDRPLWFKVLCCPIWRRSVIPRWCGRWWTIWRVDLVYISGIVRSIACDMGRTVT